MDALEIGQKNAVVISLDKKELIEAGVSHNTLQAYRRALDTLAIWLDTELNDAVLAEYITQLHQVRQSSEHDRASRRGGQVASKKYRSPGSKMGSR